MKNEYRVLDGVCYIQLQNNIMCKIDEKDMTKIKKYKWYSKGSKNYYYAVAHADNNSNSNSVLMHRLIVSPPEGMFVDHINHDTYNNTRKNLRIVTQRENCLNMRPRKGGTSEYQGVCWASHAKKWRAEMIKIINGKRKKFHVGYFHDELEAGIARANAFVEHYGKKANPLQTKLSTKKGN